MILGFWGEVSKKTKLIEYIDFIESDGNAVKNKIECRVDLTNKYDNSESIKKKFASIKKILLSDVGGSIIYSNVETKDSLYKIFETCDIGIECYSEYIIGNKDYLSITRNRPANNSNIRFNRALSLISKIDVSTKIKDSKKQEIDTKQIKIDVKPKVVKSSNNNIGDLSNVDPYEGIVFVRNKKSLVYHKVGCGLTRKIKEDSKEVFDASKITAEMKPCKLCLKSLVSESQLAKHTNGVINNSVGSSNCRYSGIGSQIIAICDKYGINASLFDDTVVIMTAAGGWKFNFCERPVKLYHQNYFNISCSVANHEYHLQSAECYSPLDALAYIIKHDNERINRMLTDAIDK